MGRNRMLRITENRIDVIRNANPDVPQELFDELITWDPSTNNKYIAWIVKNVKRLTADKIASLQRLKQTGNDVRPSLEYFHQHLQAFEKRDINAYRSFKELEDAVKDVSAKRSKTVERGGSAEKIYEDDDVLIVRPDDKKAAMRYGANTRWCITMRDADYYEQYTEANVLFYFAIAKRNTDDKRWSKVAIVWERKMNNALIRDTAFDAQDNEGRPTQFVQFLYTKGERSTWPDVPSNVNSLLKLIEDDAKSRPKSIAARLKQGEDVSSQELRTFWIGRKDGEFLSTKEMLELASLPIKQQREIATYDARVDARVNDELEPNSFFETSPTSGDVVVITPETAIGARFHVYERMSDRKRFIVRMQDYAMVSGVEQEKLESFDGVEIVRAVPPHVALERYKKDLDEPSIERERSIRLAQGHELGTGRGNDVPRDALIDQRNNVFVRLKSNKDVIPDLSNSVWMLDDKPHDFSR